uniref:Uncharacterized protein n=1 Tax=Arundo donax TaxID=35708 RepID=A0A0A9CGL2_ARUDO
MSFSLNARHQQNGRKWICRIPIARKHKLISMLNLPHVLAIMEHCILRSLEWLHSCLQTGWWILSFALG